jgi:integrase
LKARLRGDGSIIHVKGSPFWQARFYDLAGRKISISTKTTDRNEALRFLAREVKRVRDEGQASTSDARKLSYGDMRRILLSSYTELGNKSLRTDAEGVEYICGLPVLDKFFGFDERYDGPPAVTIGTDKVRQFIRKRQEEGTGSAAINRSLALLRRMFKLSLHEKKLSAVPYIPMLKEPPARKGFVSMEDFRTLLGFFPSRLKPLVLFLYTSGVRIGEASQIEWHQVDLDRRVIRLQEEQTKNAEPRTVPLVSELAAMLRDIHKPSGLVFDSTNIRREWIAACTASGLGRTIEVEDKPYDPRYEGLTIHDLRRSAVRNLVTLAGVPERVAMSISGHKTRAVFDRYHIVNEADQQAAARALEALQDGNGKNLLSKPKGDRTGKVRSPRKQLTSGTPRK